MRASIQKIPGGRAGLQAKIRQIKRLVEGAKRDPHFRQGVVEVIAGVPERDWSGEVRTIMDWVRDRVRYTRDPHAPGGLELFVDPKLLLQQARSGTAAGDCDDHVMLAAAMLETVGHPVRYRVGGPSVGRYQHIWLDVLQPGQGWVPMELTKNDAALGWDPSARFAHTETYKGGLMSLGDLPTIQRLMRRVERTSGGPPSHAAGGVSLGPSSYRGLLPSDLMRQQRFLEDQAGISVDEMLAQHRMGLGDPDSLEGFSKFFKKILRPHKKLFAGLKKYAPQVMNTLGPMASMIPGIGPGVGMALNMGTSLIGSRGGTFPVEPGGQFQTRFAGRMPAQLDRYGALFNTLVGGRSGPPDMMGYSRSWDRGRQYLERYMPSAAPRVSRFYSMGRPSASPALNPFRRTTLNPRYSSFNYFTDSSLGWIPPATGTLVGQYAGTEAKDLPRFVAELKKQLLAEWKRLGYGPKTWATTSVQSTGVMAEYPTRPGFPMGGELAFEKDWGAHFLKMKPWQVFAALTWVLQHGKLSSVGGTHISPRARAEWARDAALQAHAALWQQAARAVVQKKASEAEKKRQAVLAAAEKKRLEELAKEADRQRQIEQEQLQKELAHQRKMEELRRRGATDEQIRAAEQRRATERAGVQFPRLPAPRGAPPRRRVPAGGIGVAALGVGVLALLFLGKR